MAYLYQNFEPRVNRIAVVQRVGQRAGWPQRSLLWHLSHICEVRRPGRFCHQLHSCTHLCKCAKSEMKTTSTHSAVEFRSVAQPRTKPGSLENQRTTSKTKRLNTLISPKLMVPSWRCCSRITLYAAISFSVLAAPQPHVFLKLEESHGSQNFHVVSTVKRGANAGKMLHFLSETHLNPMKTNCSQSQASVSMRIIFGNANPNQEAKLITSSFSGNNL